MLQLTFLFARLNSQYHQYSGLKFAAKKNQKFNICTAYHFNSQELQRIIEVSFFEFGT